MSVEISSLKDSYEEKSVFYKSLNVRVAAFKRDGDWHNCRTVIKFSFDDLEKGFQRLVDINDFVVIDLNTDPDSFREIVDQVFKTNQINLQDFSILFSENPRIRYELWISRNRERSKERLERDWPVEYYTMEWTHKYKNDLQSILDQFAPRLRCYDPPYESVFDCVHSFLELKTFDFRRGSSNDSICNFLFPLEASIQRYLLEGTNFMSSVQFHRDIDPKDLRLNVISKGGDQAQRLQLTFPTRYKKTKQVIRTTTIKRTLRDSADVQAFLFIKGKSNYLDQRTTRNIRSEINSRLLAHQIFDTNDKFSEYLRAADLRNQGARNFEWAVITLLHFCGFQTELIGKQGLGPTPDILAFHPEKDAIIVGECDTGVPDPTKILNLQRRKEMLEKRIQGTILAVLFSVAADASLGERFPDIRLIGRDTLENIFSATSRGENIDVIWQMLESS